MMDNGFTIKKAQAVKGIAVFLLLIHHLFINPADWNGYAVRFFVLSTDQMTKIAVGAKVCVAMFVFLTAYGMALKYKNEAKTGMDLVKISLKKYVFLLISFIFVFLLTQIAWLVLNKGTNLHFYGNGISAIGLFMLDGLGISFFLGGNVLNGVWWYMSLLFCVLCILPIVWKVKDCLGVLIVPAAFLLPAAFGLNGYIMPYLPTIALGVFAADASLIDKFAAWGNARSGVRLLKWCVYFFVFVAMFILRCSANFNIMITNAVLAFCCVLIVNEILGKIPALLWVLQLFGKYSFGIYMVHSLFILYFFEGKIFALRYGEVIFVALAVVSLLVAALVSFLEKICGVTRLKKYLSGKM